jgi:hypothetical protein
MRKLFAVVLAVLLTTALPLSANEISYRSLQSGSATGTTPLYDHGIHGEGQIIAVLDTGLDYDNCFFAEPDGSAPPINVRVTDTVVNPARRKVIAYDFLYSCTAYPNAPSCDDPADPLAYDNQGHGTHAAASAVADRLTPIEHDYGDAIATGAKLVVQDAGLSSTDFCTSRPGIGCPANMTPILTQAYAQGARIHSNSWGDHSSPTANYSAAARDIDAFVDSHPDMLVVFNTGNYATNDPVPPNTLSSPGCAKNTLQVGGTRMQNDNTDDVLAGYSLQGPARDGRIKPDIVGPAFVLAGDTDLKIGTNNCSISFQGGTSWSSPTIAGAAALVRQYYTDGFYPSGVATAANKFTPTAALLKATIIAAARRVPTLFNGATGPQDAKPTPSGEQGWGFPVLDDALYFPGDVTRLHVNDDREGLAQGQTATTSVTVTAGVPLKAVLVWTDPPGTPHTSIDTTPALVNDLDLRVVAPNGTAIFGNDSLHPGQADRINNVEVVSIPTPTTGTYVITVNAARVTTGKQSYALVVTGDLSEPAAPRTHTRAARH